MKRKTWKLWGKSKSKGGRGVRQFDFCFGGDFRKGGATQYLNIYNILFTYRYLYKCTLKDIST